MKTCTRLLKVGAGTENNGTEKVMVNRLVTIVENVGNIITFFCTKQLLEPMRPLITFLQYKVSLFWVQKL